MVLSITCKCRGCGQGFDANNNPIGHSINAHLCLHGHTGPFDPMMTIVAPPPPPSPTAAVALHHPHRFYPQPKTPTESLEDWMSEPPLACTVITVRIVKEPKRVRCHFAKQLAEFGRSTGRHYGGYVKRESPMLVTAHIVTEDTASSDELHDLWSFLHTHWNVGLNDVLYEHHDYVNVSFLTGRFKVVQPNGEAEDWFSKEEEAASDYSIVSSIPNK